MVSRIQISSVISHSRHLNLLYVLCDAEIPSFSTKFSFFYQFWITTRTLIGHKKYASHKCADKINQHNLTNMSDMRVCLPFCVLIKQEWVSNRCECAGVWTHDSDAWKFFRINGSFINCFIEIKTNGSIKPVRADKPHHCYLLVSTHWPYKHLHVMV